MIAYQHELNSMMGCFITAGNSFECCATVEEVARGERERQSVYGVVDIRFVILIKDTFILRSWSKGHPNELPTNLCDELHFSIQNHPKLHTVRSISYMVCLSYANCVPFRKG